MKNYHFLILLGVLFPLTFYGQSNAALPSDCGCKVAFEQAVDKVTRIYAGFDDKVTSANRSVYEAFLKDLSEKAGKTTSKEDCRYILRQYVGFFKDSHVSVYGDWSAESPAEKKKDIPVEFKPLDKEFLYVKLPVFNIREVKTLDSLIIANKKLLAETPYLIFDFRGNGGGDASASDEMIKLIYTHPIIYPEWQYRFSKEYIDQIESWIKEDTNNLKYAPGRALLDEMKKSPGQLAGYHGDITITHEVTPEQYPGHIAFLIDKGCGSATEFFIFSGKQSKKVTLFGTNTHGVMDYGLTQTYGLCDGAFYMGIATGRNGWVKDFRIDNVGFEPDVRIPSHDLDWVEFVKNYYHQKKK
ncbi:MAG: S41 family peptidase [Leadbetterella sp.]|nr:S41 family peptidase [Leadbetterella sp.]